ncbi:PKD domain-containing protein, partial [Cyclobacteriaceae bacterium]|nr:PKD domain-containing protein [Cyclobacteriaceae bacterium]
ANYWHFGAGGGLDFSDINNPIGTASSIGNVFEGTASMSDPSGNLLMYTDGKIIYDADGTVMPNGTGLGGDGSSVQSGVIIPNPADPNLYYVFSQSGETASGGSTGLKYSVVDLSLPGNGTVVSPKGDVVNSSKNTVLVAGTSQSCAAAPNETGGFWIITRKAAVNGAYYAFEIDGTTGNLNTTAVISGGAGTVFTSYPIAAIKFNNCSNKMASLSMDDNKVEIWDFDRATGQVTGTPDVFHPGAVKLYGLEFSPNGDYLYVSGHTNRAIYQYDVAANTYSQVGTSAYNTNGSLQLAPDKKIYMASQIGWNAAGNYNLQTIDDPNIGGNGCNFNTTGVSIPDATGINLGLPPFASSFVSNVLIISHTDLCVNSPVAFSYTFSGTYQAGSISWDFGDGNTSTDESPTHTYTTSGTYNVTVSVRDAKCNELIETTLQLKVGPDPITDPGLEYCSGDPVDLTMGDGVDYCYYTDANETDLIGCGDPVSHTFTGSGDQTVYVNVDAFTGGTHGPTALAGNDDAWGADDEMTFTVVKELMLVSFDMRSQRLNGATAVTWSLSNGATGTFNPGSTMGTVQINQVLGPGIYTMTFSRKELNYSTVNDGFNDPSILVIDQMSWTNGLGQSRSGYFAANWVIEPVEQPWCAAQPIVVSEKTTGCCVQPTPTLTLTAGTSPFCTGEGFVLTAAPSGAASATYQLYKDGVAEGAPQTSTSWAISGAVVSDAADYTVSITTSGSCSGEGSQSAAVTIAVNESPTDPVIVIAPNQNTFCAGEAHTLTASSTVGSGTLNYTWSGDGSSTSAAETGITTAGSYTYTVSVEANGCAATNTASESIMVNESPTDPVIVIAPNQNTFCAGEAHTLTASSTVGSGTLNYTWSGDGSSSTSTQAGITTVGSYTYTVSVEANGCTAANTASESITVTSSPSAVISGGGSICNDGSTSNIVVTVTDGTGPFDFNIFRNGGAHNALIDEASPYTEGVTADGAYTLETGSLVDVNGCSGAVSGTATVVFVDDVLATATTECNTGSPEGGVTLSGDEYQIVVTVTQGDLSSISVTETSSVGGIVFTETSTGSGIWYSGAINESNTVGINVTDGADCNGGVDIGGLTSTCSCPAVVDDFTIAAATICEEGNTTITVEYSSPTGSPSTYNVTLTQPDGSTVPLTGESGPTSTFTVDQLGAYSVEVFSVGDNCPANSSGVSLAHHAVPEAVLSGDNSICNEVGLTTDLTVALTQGTAPFNVDITGGVLPINVVSASTPHTEPVSEAATYGLATLTDANGCVGTVSGSAIITHKDDVLATHTTECDDGSPLVISLADDEYQIVVTVTQGDLSSISVTETSSVGGIVFTETSTGSGIWYSGAINESNTVDINVTDVNDCNGGVDITAITETCSCPSSATLASDVAEICDNGTDVMTLTVTTASTSGTSANYAYTITGPGAPITGTIATTGGTATETVSAAGTYVLTVLDGGESCNSSTSGQEETLLV